MTGSLRAELLVLRKRASTWILLGIWATLALVFAYVVPYATYLNDRPRMPSRTCSPKPGRHPDGRVPVLRRRARAHARRPRLRQRVRLGHAEDALHAASWTAARLRGPSSSPSPSRSSPPCSWSLRWARSPATRSRCAKGRTSPGRRRGFSSAGLPPAGSSWPCGRRSGCCSPSSSAGPRSRSASASSTRSSSRACSARSRLRPACSTRSSSCSCARAATRSWSGSVPPPTTPAIVARVLLRPLRGRRAGAPCSRVLPRGLRPRRGVAPSRPRRGVSSPTCVLGNFRNFRCARPRHLTIDAGRP